MTVIPEAFRTEHLFVSAFPPCQYVNMHYAQQTRPLHEYLNISKQTATSIDF